MADPLLRTTKAPHALLPLLASVRGIDRLLPLRHRRPDVEYDVDVDVGVVELSFVFRMHANLVDASGGSLYDAAQRIAAFDLMITIDSMPAHLAGARGIPVCTLFLQNADWRWMEERTDRPWYSTMRLFRQERDGDWKGVVERVVGALSANGQQQGDWARSG